MASLIKTPEGSLTLGIATATLVVGIYTTSTPDTGVIHATDPNDHNIDAGRKKAAWLSAAVVSAIALLMRDKTVFVLGGTVLIALDWHTRHANAVSPQTGKVVSNEGYEPASDGNLYNMPTSGATVPVAG
jgi:hypothetical protein